MASPILNEHLILTQLHPDTVSTPDDLRVALALCVLDCYDRKVEREFFFDMLNQYQKGITLLKQLEIAARVDSDKPEPSPVMVKMIKQMSALRQTTHDMMLRVAECPLDSDSVS